MINTFFTSDHHFGHKNILEYEKEYRPFSSLEEMHEVMIERWNNVVRNNDIVYHLGDFCFGRNNIEIASRLNGKKRIILGNHDIYPVSDYMRYFDKVFGILYWKMCILTHIPVHPNQLGSRTFLNVHGHLHSKKVLDSNYDDHCESCLSYYHNNENIPEDRNYMNVSCEQNNLTPIHADCILERLREVKES